MSKNVVRKGNRNIIDRILTEMTHKLEIAVHSRERDDSDSESYFLNSVRELRDTAFNLYLIGVFNRAEHEFFAWEYVRIVVEHGFTVDEVRNSTYTKE